MTIHDIINYFPEKYICVHNTKRNALQLITEADILCVYDTLRIAAENKNMIKRYMQQYPDFDIIYGDYDDYFTTRYWFKVKEDAEYSAKLATCGTFIPTQGNVDLFLLHLEFMKILEHPR